MNIKELELKILELDKEIKKLLEENNFFNSENLETVTYDNTDLNDCMLHKEFRLILSKLEYVHFIITYLQKPVRQEGMVDEKHELNGIKLSEENAIEIIKYDEVIKAYAWHPTVLEECQNLKGMKARIR